MTTSTTMTTTTTTTTRTTTRTRTQACAALALAGALVLTACGGGDDTATGSGMERGGGHSSASSAPSAGSVAAATGDDADVAFLTGMKPHHEQAVEMSDLVLAADPPAPVAELARQVKAAQAPEIEQMDRMLADMRGEHGEDHMGDGMTAHGGMMNDADMAELMGATGTDAARLYLEGMIEHHEGAIDAAEKQIADGEHAPAVDLARTIAQDQAAEITRMRQLLATL